MTSTGSGDVIIRNVRVFDSRAGRLSETPQVVVVRGTTIDAIHPLGVTPAEAETGATVIEGGGRTLIPGLIDAHWHATMATVPMPDLMTADLGYIHLSAGAAATQTVLRGFTTVRDMGGPAFGLKRAIDTGVITGPRIFPSGAMISQTSGHGDFRSVHELPRGRTGEHSYPEMAGVTSIADGADEVLRAAREQLMQGASQLKVLAGGGVASAYDPLEATQYTEAEIHAAVAAAQNWGTYVAVHAYTPHAVRQAIRAGVKSIEHGHLLDEATVELMAAQGIWWSMQPFLDDEDTPPQSPASRVKNALVARGTDNAYALARKYGIPVAWGTDTLFSPELAARQGHRLAGMTRWFTPAEILTMATATNADLLALSGPRNPYPGRLGVIEPGALADLLVFDGNPLDDITMLGRPDEALALIVKDGAVVKNTLAATAARFDNPDLIASM
ncbi:metal-dependent hydrolase family protein [Nocardia altamirensis]|uniref:metal-dependent hydrolase family protein n=1 Tax=Nocardia altamirensis TaxID=472158 RepID=UPI0008402D17|nr:amidohydrolase family protein [Nocardia altamirensis]